MNFLNYFRHRIGYAARVAALCGLLGGIGHAQAAVNYLVITGSGYAATQANFNATMSVSISSSCPPGAVPIYYGLSTLSLLVSNSTGALGSGTVCVAGIPNSITLTPVAGFVASPIALTLDGGIVNLISAGSTGTSGVQPSTSYVGLILPDNKIAGVYVYICDAATCGSVYVRVFFTIVTPVKATSYSGYVYAVESSASILANYVVGY